MAREGLFCVATSDSHFGRERGETMTGAMMAFGIAVGGTSLICVALVSRLQNRRGAGRRSSRGSYGADAGSGNDAGNGAGHFHSTNSDHSASDHSSNSSDSGDGGGGGGDGGGND
jgi:hypothetical protein